MCAVSGHRWDGSELLSDGFSGFDHARGIVARSEPVGSVRFLDNQPWLKGDCYRHAVWLNVSDAKARGIVDGDLVKVYNDIGEMIIPAYVTARVVPGTVCIFHGGWYKPSEQESPLMPEGIDRGGAPNVLTHDEDLPQTVVGNFACKGLVQIEKWEGA